jgi:hypothetical protein
VWFGPISLLNPHPDIPLQPVLSEPDFTDSTEDELDKPVTLPSGPADDIFLGDGSDYPDRGVWFEYLDPSWSRFVGFAERPAEGVPGKTWWKPLEPYQLQWCGVGSENLFTPIRLPLGPAEDVPETGYVPDKLWTITGNEMSIAGFGSTDQITRIKTAEGGTTYSTDIEKLVQAMASFAPPAAMQTSWTSGQTITGNMLLERRPPAGPKTIPLAPASILLRGSTLRNTKRVFGAVIFAGHETKVPAFLCWVDYLSW